MKTRLISVILMASICVMLACPAFADNVKLVAFTFDDGPSLTYTPELLDGLAERDVKVTFFLVGTMVSNNPEIVRREMDEGHQIESHTQSHAKLSVLSDEALISEIETVAQSLTEITGLENFMLRPPYGAVNQIVAEAANVPLIMWSVDPFDGTNSKDEEALYNNLISGVHDGAIILMHDTTAANVNAALRAIDTLRQEGYEFVTLDELFRLRGVTPENGVKYYSLLPSYEQKTYSAAQLAAHWAADYIGFVTRWGLMTGDYGNWLPDEPVSVSEAEQVIRQVFGIADSVSLCGSMDLVGDSMVSREQAYVLACYAICMTAVVEKTQGSFSIREITMIPQTSIVPAKLGKLSIMELFGKQLTHTNRGNYLGEYRDDWRISAFARRSVARLRKEGFSSENDVELFRPQDTMTRAELAELATWLANWKE